MPDIKYDTSFLMGKFNPKDDTRFVEIEPVYADRPGRLMNAEAYLAFKKMHAAAAEENIDLKIISATRNFEYQKGIWERKWSGRTLLEGRVNAAEIADSLDRCRHILRYSAMPGASRHHWGTDIDLNSLNNSYFESGQGKKVFEWLEKNASAYGFCRPYDDKSTSGRSGYEEEKWHWSYIPLSKKMTEDAKAQIEDNHFSDFLGSEHATEVDVTKSYILGIAKDCQ